MIISTTWYTCLCEYYVNSVDSKEKSIKSAKSRHDKDSKLVRLVNIAEKKLPPET